MAPNRRPPFPNPPDNAANRHHDRPTPTSSSLNPDPLPTDPAHLHECVHVAVEISSLLIDPLEHHSDRTLVVADIVTCWHHLPSHTRHTYTTRPGPTGGVIGFACDYLDTIDLQAYRDTTPGRLPAEEAETRNHRAWTRHVATIRNRHHNRQLPPQAWLDQFPL